MTKVKFVAAGVLAFLLLATAVGGTLVMAQGPTTTPTTPAASPTTGTTAPTTGATPAAPKSMADLYWQILAQKFGMSVSQLQQTITDARKQAITQGVQQGLITQAQADRLTQQLQNAGPGTVFDNFGRGRGNDQRNSVYSSVISAAQDAAAKALGMSTNDLTTALRGGKTLLDLTREKNVDVSTLRTAIANAAKAALDQAAKDGKLTQAQADSLKNNITPDNINLNTRSIQLPFGMGGFGPGNNQRRFPPGRGFGPGDNNQGSQPGRGFRWQ